MSTVNKRNPVISISRIVGMLFIIMCHIIKYYYFIPMYNFLGHFLNCGVQLFLFISGYLYGGKVIQNFKLWYAKRSVLIAIPSIVVSLFLIIALFIVGNPPTINSIIAYCLDVEGLLFLNWDFFSAFFNEIPSLGPLWFTTVIMLCYLLIPLLQTITDKIENYTKFLSIFLIVGIILSVALYNYCTLYYFIPFVLGYIARKVNFLEKISSKAFWIYTTIFVVFLIVRIVLQKTIDGTYLYLAYVNISHIFIGIWFVILFAYLYNHIPSMISQIADTNIAKIIDKYSFYIYLTHGIFCAGEFNMYGTFSLPIATMLFVLFTTISAVFLKMISDMIYKVIFEK